MGVDPKSFTEANPHSFNRYAYGNNNPYKYVDPDGEAALPVVILGWYTVGAAIGGGMNAVMQYGMTGSIDWGVNGVLGAAAESAPLGIFAAPMARRPALGLGGVTKSAKGLKPTLKQENPRNLIPTQTKSEMSGSQVKRLAKDMKQNGFDQNKPVDAWRNPKTGRLEIQDGHHRTEAAKKAGLNKIPVQIWE